MAPFLTKNCKIFHLFVVIWTGTISISCQTIGGSEEESKEEQILATEKSLVLSFLNRGLPGMALKDLKKLLTEHPEDPDLHNLMGLTFLALKNPDQAIKAFQAASRIEARIPFELNEASALIEAGKFQKSIAVLTKLKKRDDYSSYQHPERIDHNIGLALERLNKPKMARNYYRKALKNNPAFYISLIRIGHVNVVLKQSDHARKAFRNARNVCPRCFEPASALAQLYIAEGQPKKAVGVLQRFLKTKDTTKGDLMKAKELMQMARGYSKSQQGRF